MRPVDSLLVHESQPDIQLDSDLQDISATKKHFARLFSRYGTHVTCLSLLRQTEKKPKEAIVGSAFGKVVSKLNDQLTAAQQGDSPPQILEEDEEQAADRDVEEMSTVTDSASNRGGFRVSASTTSVEDALFTAMQTQDGLPIHYITYDFLHHAHKAKERGISVFDALAQLAESIFPNVRVPLVGPIRLLAASLTRRFLCCFIDAPQLGCFVEGVDDQYIAWAGQPDDLLAQARNGQGVKQFGVLRTNCIDCLDRTNVAQFCFARANLVHMLHGLGIDLHPGALSEVWRILLEMWAENGDQMAKQYGGSGAMHKVDDVATDVDGERELVLTGGAKNALVRSHGMLKSSTTPDEFVVSCGNCGRLRCSGTTRTR